MSIPQMVWGRFSGTMDTLSNAVDPHLEETRRADAGLISDPIALEADVRSTGVSVENAPKPTAERWYVLRASYGRAVKAEQFIRSEGTLTYMPLHRVLRIRRGQKQYLSEPLLPNFLFVFADPKKVDRYVRDTPQLPYVSYYYNHFAVNAYGVNPPLVIADAEMRNFIRATSVDSPHIKVADPDLISLKAGDAVRVIEGPFTGVEGRVVRYAGQQRVAVTLTGFVTVLTAYVPTGFLERL